MGSVFLFSLSLLVSLFACGLTENTVGNLPETTADKNNDAANMIAIGTAVNHYDGYGKRGGGRGFVTADFEEDKRAGGRGFLPYARDARGGGRAFELAEFDRDARGGARAFASGDLSREMRGGGRGFPGFWSGQTGLYKRGGARAFYTPRYFGSAFSDMGASGMKRFNDNDGYQPKRGGARSFRPNYWRLYADSPFFKKRDLVAMDDFGGE